MLTLVSYWTPDERDQEIRHINNVTKGVAVAAVGGTILLGAGIAWGDQQRITQADNREAAQTTPSTPATIQPPKTNPTKAPAGGSSSKSKSGGS